MDEKNHVLHAEPERFNIKGGDVEFLTKRNFVNRKEELEKLGNLFGRPQQAVSITGRAGAGKTFLVEEYISQLMGISVEWLRSENSIDLFREVDDLLVKIRSSNERRKYLVVIDEVHKFHVTELQDYLRKIFNYKAVEALIFISRLPLNIPHLYRLHLEPLTQEDFLKWSQSKHGVIYTIEEPEEKQIIETAKPQIVVINNALLEKLKTKPEDLYKISPRQFEEVVADLLSGMGWEVTLTKATRDGGKDILAYKETGLNKILCLVEAKKYGKTNPVGIGLVRQLHSTLMHEKANMGMMVTTSRFSPDSHKFQKNYEYQLSLKEYADVVSWLLSYKS